MANLDSNNWLLTIILKKIIKAESLPPRLITKLLLAIGLILLSILHSYGQKVDKLEQWANGRLDSVTSPVGWITGNEVPSKAHLAEGMTLPYRVEAINLSGDSSYCITIGWDTKKNGKNALDYITSYDNDFNHFRFGHLIEDIPILLNTALAGTSPSMDSMVIPTPSFPGAEEIALGKVLAAFNNTPDVDKQIKLFNGTIDSMRYVFEGNLAGESTTTYSTMQVCFTVASGKTEVVLAWGGHIAWQEIWGMGESASAINGSPYHTFLEDCDGPFPNLGTDDLTGCGQKDVQLSASAVDPIPEINIILSVPLCANESITVSSETNSLLSLFDWEIVPSVDNVGAVIVGDTINDSLVLYVGSGGSIEITASILVPIMGGFLSAEASITFNIPNQLSSGISAINPACVGDSSGSADLTVGGGTAPYTFSWSNGETTEDLSNLTAGIYIVTITDSNSCVLIDTTFCEDPPPLVLSEDHTDILCFGDSSTVTISAQGGTPPYTGTGMFSQTAGSVDYVVIDTHGCSDTITVTIGQPNLLVLAEQHTDIPCFGDSSMVTISAQGGTPPYSGTGVYKQAAGSMDYMVVDSNGCADIISVTIGEPDLLALSEQHTDILCFGGSSSVTISAQGGTAPYTGTGVFSQTVGSVDYIVADTNGCSDTITVTIGQPNLLVLAEQHTAILCYGDSSSVTISAEGGTAPYTGTGVFKQAVGSVDYIVADTNGCADTITVTIGQPDLLVLSKLHTDILCFGDSSSVTISAQGGTLPYTGTGVFSQAVGSVDYIVADSNGCADTITVTIGQPNLLVLSEQHTAIPCFGDSSMVTISAQGGTAPYTGTGMFKQAVGSVDYIVADTNGCADTITVTIGQPDLLVLSEQHTAIPCFGDSSSVTISAQGGTLPYTGTGVFSQAVGSVDYIVADTNGCADTITVTIGQPDLLVLSEQHTDILCFGDTSWVTISAQGGTLPYSGTGMFSQVVGSVDYIVADSNGCADTITVTIGQPDMLAASEQHTDILCFGDSSSVTISAQGGSPPYSGTGVYSQAVGSVDYIVADSNGCADTVTVTIGQPDLLVLSEQHTPIQCFGDSSWVTISAQGGTIPYSGTGLFRQAVGSVDYIVADTNGCADTITVTIGQPDLLVLDEQHTDILCYGDSSVVTISAQGGTAPYTGTGMFMQAVGSVDYIVTDTNACADTITVTIGQPDLLVLSEQHTDIQCFGDTSWVTISALGGTAPYSGTGMFSQIVGSVDYIVADTNGCSDTITVTIGQPDMLAASEQHTDILCFGDSSSVTISAQGGTPPYSGTGVFMQAVGSVDYIVADSNDCVDTVTVTIGQPDLLVLSEQHTDIPCFGDSSSVTISAQGGTLPYSGTGVFSQAVGSVDYIVADSNGCADTITVTIGQPDLLVLSQQHTDILCFGDSSSVTISAQGGTTPYTGTGVYQQAAGSTDYIVADSNGCADTITVIIGQPDLLVLSEQQTEILCFGDSSWVTISAQGGTPPYSGTGVFSQFAGSVDYIVADTNGCSDTITVIISQPPLLVSSEQHTDILCYGDSSTVTISAQGGTPPYSGTGVYSQIAGTVDYVVVDAKDCIDTVTVTIGQPDLLALFEQHTEILCFGDSSSVTISASGGTAPYSGTGVFSQAVGSTDYIVADTNGCADTITVTIGQPDLLVLAEQHTDILCYGDSSWVTISAQGGTAPYTGTGLFQQAVGSMDYIVADTNGCADTITVTIGQPDLLALSEQHTDILCFGGLSSVTISAQGGTAPYSGTGVFSQAAGSTDYIVLDTNGCRDTITVFISQPGLLVALAHHAPILCFGDSSLVTISGRGGTTPYTGVGSFNQGAGSVDYIVVDARGCRDTITVTLSQPNCLVPEIKIPNELPICGSLENILSASVSGGTGAYTYSWMVNSQSGEWMILAGQDSSQITYKAGLSNEIATFILIVIDGNGCMKLDTITMECTPPTGAHCTLTQGFYGNKGGLYCDRQTTIELIEELLSIEPIVIGTGPTDILTLSPGDALCIIDRLPAGSKSKKFSTGPNTCTVAPGVEQRPKGRFKNNLLGQMMTLSLNLRLDNTLGGFVIGGEQMVTGEADTCNFTGAGLIPFTEDTFNFPSSVIAYLGGNPSVSDLLTLGNEALGGTYVPSGPSDPTFGDITQAIGGINDGFDECRVFIDFIDLDLQKGTIGAIDDNVEYKLNVFPNPFKNQITFELDAIKEGYVHLQLYSLTGVLVETIYYHNVAPNSSHSVTYRSADLSPGVYFYKLIFNEENVTGIINHVR